MTAEQWQNLRKKKVVPTETKEIIPIHLTEATVQQESEEDNPFALLNDEASAVETVQLMVSPEAERLPMIAQNESPKAYAVLYAKAHWMQQHGSVERAELRRKIGNYLLMFGVSRKGKENRASKVLDALKFINQQEFELEKSTGRKLVGK